MTHPKLLAIFVLAISGAAALAAGCASNPEDACYRNPDGCAASNAGTHQYVVASLEFPESLADSDIGLDLDGDGDVDNNLVSLLPGLRNAADFDLAKVLGDGIRTGDLILLVEVTATALDDAEGVVGRVLVGENPSIEPCVGDSDADCGHHLVPGTRFDVDQEALFDAAVNGEIVSSEFAGGPNAIEIEIDLREIADVPAFVLDGEGVVATARRTASGLSGSIGGGVRAKQIEEAILPALIETAHDTCQPHQDPEVCCVRGTIGAQLISQFDAEPYNCRLDVAELKNDQLVSSMLAPTLDLLNDAGQFEPNGDGVLDSMSIGARFKAIPASF